AGPGADEDGSDVRDRPKAGEHDAAGSVAPAGGGGPEDAREAGGADARAVVVAQDDLEAGRTAAEMSGGGDTGDVPSAHAAVVGGVDVHAHGEAARAGIEGGCDRAEALGEHARGAAVQQAERLGVAVDRHPGDHAFGTRLDVLDAEAVVQWGLR